MRHGNIYPNQSQALAAMENFFDREPGRARRLARSGRCKR
jgi:hypothetical protein